MKIGTIYHRILRTALVCCSLSYVIWAQSNITQNAPTETSWFSTKNVTITESATTTQPAETKKLNCRRPSSVKELSTCCINRIKRFERNWYKGGSYLQTFFEGLESLQCPQLKQVCARQVYAKFSEYSRLVYASHCNKNDFHGQCKDIVADVRDVPRNQSWNDVVLGMSSAEFTMVDLQQPCLQIALYESKSGGFGFYHEIVDVYIPFCDISWCGFDTKTIEEREISSWDCMPSSCQTNLTVAAIICGLLATAIVLANVTVIVVFTTSPKLRNSQAVYKISLAIADLFVGAVVLPTFISSLMILYQDRVRMGVAMVNRPKNSEGTISRKSGGHFEQRFSSEYINFVGFFTVLSLIVSIYTLMMASFDRFMAIDKPLKYSRHRAKRIAMWGTLGLWITAIFFSVLPTFVSGMRYGLAASVMMAAMDVPALIMYAVVVLIPLILVWGLTFATYLSTKKHSRVRRTMIVRRGIQGNKSYSNMEARLARTLATMVGIFTACLLPAAIILIVPHGLSNIYHEYPKKFDPMASKIFLAMEFVTIMVLMTNSLWNCFIYNARSDEFEKRAKYLYARLLRALGFNALWRKTRSFASSTMRSRSTMNTTIMTTRRMRRVSNDITKTNCDTNPNMAAGCNGKHTEIDPSSVTNTHRHSHDDIQGSNIDLNDKEV